MLYGAPPGTDVPQWLRRAVVGGLAPDRKDRPGSMPELLAALRADPSKRRTRWVAAAAAHTTSSSTAHHMAR